MRNFYAATVALLACVFASTAFAIPQAPHDASNNVSCTDCHAPYAGLSDPGTSVGGADANSTSTTLSDATMAWSPALWVDGVITFTSGANDGQFRTITSSNATSVSWALPLPAPLSVGDTYKLGKTTYADVENKCKSCHNPTGPASAYPHVGLHLTNKGLIGCGKCHDPHGIDVVAGTKLIRPTLRLGQGKDVTFPSTGTNKFITANHDGMCQVCHTKTKYYRNDVSSNDNHMASSTTCTGCHKHEEGFNKAMASSGHGDATAKAWTYSSIANNPCAKCHTVGGVRDYLGADGSAANVLDGTGFAKAPLTCNACHNSQAEALTSVIMPSGVVVGDTTSSTKPTTLDNASALCMTCHQGRESTVSVDAYILGKAPATDDTVDATMGFRNVHYFAAGATVWGGVAQGGYEYAGMVYDINNRHVASKISCIDCHDNHKLEVKLTTCASCHTGVNTVADLHDVRMFGSTGDYDGDGNRTEGLYYEIDGLKTILYTAIRAYALNIAGKAIVFDSSSHPYWFADENGDGIRDPLTDTKYVNFTARLVRATYNFQFASKDPGGYAHGPKYIFQLLHDSIDDLNSVLGGNAVAFAGERDDAGHFDGASEAFRHWDSNLTTQGSCAKCHGGAVGFLNALAGKAVGVPAPNGMECVTCHNADSAGDPVFTELRSISSVTFPGGVVTSMADAKNNICATCHSGRESKASVDAAIASNKPGFKNVHYLASASVLMGSTTHVGYEYDGKTYAGPMIHFGGAQGSCVQCHKPIANAHTFNVADSASACSGCHGSTNYASFKKSAHSGIDYDGNGTVQDLHYEIDGLRALAMTALQAKATANGTPICYNSGAYPYFFKDTNGNGVCESGESSNPNKFAAWTADLARAAFNYQFASKDHGAWAHNFDYTAQLLVDTIEACGGDVSGLTRP